MKGISGRDLSRAFYMELVRGPLEREFPGLEYSAGLIGPGSEVMGFDTFRSRDHHWGPRVMVFLKKKDREKYGNSINELFRYTLPGEFRGYSTNWSSPDGIGVRLLEEHVPGQPVEHRVEMEDLENFLPWVLTSYDPESLGECDWLSFSEQSLRSLVDGVFFHDDLELGCFFERYSWYPDSVWSYLMAADWQKIGQEEPFPGRCGEVDDDLGSRIVLARLVQTAMHLAFLQERVYAPYSKWFGYAFKRLEACGVLEPLFKKTLKAESWKERENSFTAALEELARSHNRLGLTAQIPEDCDLFHGRPYRVIGGEDIAGEIEKSCGERWDWRSAPILGSVNQITRSVDARCSGDFCRTIKEYYKK